MKDPTATRPRDGLWRRLGRQEDLNFLLTNRVPRIALTHAMGRFSRIRSRWLTRLSIAVWRQFTDLDLSESAQPTFDSLHACFTRALKPDARPVDPRPEVLASPCDAIVGASGVVHDGQLFQAKGMPYAIDELFGGDPMAREFSGGQYLTLRLTSAMYHRFHAPQDGRLGDLTYISGDTWNVNPIALQRIERLFCRNERALIPLTLAGGARIALVPVAAILVASLRLHALDVRLHLKYRGPNRLPCDVAVHKGEELGWFEHGSTIIVFAPPGFRPAPGIESGARIRMGQALLLTPEAVPTLSAGDSDTALSRAGASMGDHAA